MSNPHDKRLWAVALLATAVLLYPLTSGGGVLVWDVIVSLVIFGCAVAALIQLLGPSPHAHSSPLTGTSDPDDGGVVAAADEHLVPLGARRFSASMDDLDLDAELRRILGD
jgi:hypothetical protein